MRQRSEKQASTKVTHAKQPLLGVRISQRLPPNLLFCLTIRPIACLSVAIICTSTRILEDDCLNDSARRLGYLQMTAVLDV